MAAVAPKSATGRDPFIVTVQVAKKQIGMSDDAYRDMLERVAGCRSSTKVAAGKRQAVQDELKRLGATNINYVRSTRSGIRLEGVYAGKLQSLWIAGWNLGIIRDKTDAALMKFIKRQTKLDHTRWRHNNADATKAINALKKWLERDGGVSWKTNSAAMPYECEPRYLVVSAQLRYMYSHQLIGADDLSRIRTCYAISDYAKACGIKQSSVISEYTSADWIKVMNALGEEIRAHKSGAS